MSDSRRGALLPALTSLRFFAALHVVLFHFAFVSERQAPGARPWWKLAIFNVLDVGYVAVSFFFILSGFILAYTYIPKAEQGKLDSKEFWIARFARIYPAYVFSLIPGSHTVVAVAKSTGAVAAVGLVFLKLGMLHAWTPFSARNWNDATWSLSVEALFYLCFPIAAIWVLKLKAERQPLTLMALFLVSSGFCLARFLLMRQFLISPTPAFDAIGYNQLLETIFARIPVLRLPEFLIGVLLGRRFLISATLSKPRVESPSGATHDSDASTLVGMTGSANMLFVLSGMAILGILACSRWIDSAFLESCVLVPPMAVFIYSAAGASGTISRVLSWPLLILLGEASYSLYLMHGPVAAAFRLFGPFETGLMLVLYIVAAIMTSLLVYKLIEVPSRRSIRSRFAKVPSRAVGE